MHTLVYKLYTLARKGSIILSFGQFVFYAMLLLRIYCCQFFLEIVYFLSSLENSITNVKTVCAFCAITWLPELSAESL